MATTMQAIADLAGVAVETVYAQGNKASLLTTCLDRSIVGDDEPVAFLDRPELVAILASRDQVTIVTGWARAITALAGRACRILAAFEQGAATDPALAELWRERESWRRKDYERLVARVAACGPLACGRDADAAVDVLWALIGPDTAINLLVRCGWDVPRLTDLFTELALGLLIPAMTDPWGHRGQQGISHQVTEDRP